MSEINKENYLQKIAEISKKKTEWIKDFVEIQNTLSEEKKPTVAEEFKRLRRNEKENQK